MMSVFLKEIEGVGKNAAEASWTGFFFLSIEGVGKNAAEAS